MLEWTSGTGDKPDILLNLMKNSVIGKELGYCTYMAGTIKRSPVPILGQRRKHKSMVDVLNNPVNNGRQPNRPNPFLEL